MFLFLMDVRGKSLEEKTLTFSSSDLFILKFHMEFRYPGARSYMYTRYISYVYTICEWGSYCCSSCFYCFSLLTSSWHGKL